MGKNKNQLLEEAKLLIDPKLSTIDHSALLTTLESQTKKEIQEFINDNSKIKAKPEPTTPSTTTSTDDAKSMLETKSEKKSKPKQKSIYCCLQCDYKSRNIEVVCPRHKSDLILDPSFS